MATAKALHVAKSLEELNSKVSSSKIKNATPRVLCRMGDKLLLKAKDESLSGDDEQAYILYMRFVDVVKEIRSSKTYKKDKRELDSLLPPRKVVEAIGQAESLSESLKKRYASLQSVSEEHSDDQVVPASPSGGPTGFQDQDTVNGVTERVEQLVPTSSALPSLTPTRLYSLLTSTPSHVIVVDCRKRASFNSSHPDGKRFPQWLSVPQETVLKGLSDQSVSSFLRPSAKQLWKDRATKKYIVLIDEMSTVEDLGRSDGHAPILSLRDALCKWEMATPLTPPNPYVLEGGYAMWHLSYAVTCVGAYRKPAPKQGSEVKVSKVNSEQSMEYPSFPDNSESMDVNFEPSNSDPSAISIDIEDQSPTVTVSNSNHHPPDGDHSFQPQVVSNQPVFGNTAYIPTFPSVPLPAYAPLPPASLVPPVPLSLEGESELFAPSLSEDYVGDVRTLDDLDNPLHEDDGSFGIVAEQATITQPLPGPHNIPGYPIMFDVSHGPGHDTSMPQYPAHGQDQRYLPTSHPPQVQSEQYYHHPTTAVQPIAHGPIPEVANRVPYADSSVVVNRVIDGPLPNPPTYGQSLTLPSMQLVQPPLPPPVSRSQDSSNQFAQFHSNQHVVQDPINQFGQLHHSQQVAQNPSNQFTHNQQIAQDSSNQFAQLHQHNQQIAQDSSNQFAQAQAFLAEKDARIQELEHRLARSERVAHESSVQRDEARKQQEQELHSLKDDVVKQRALLVEEADRQKQKLTREAIAMEKEKQALATEREQHIQAMNQRAKELQMMKEQFERERTLMEAAKQQQLNQHLEQRRREEQRKVFSLQSGLPSNWEKRLDSTLGRFYYVDHDTKTTHWNPPTNWINYQRAKQEEAERRNMPVATSVLPQQPQAAPTPPQSVRGQVPPVSSQGIQPRGQSAAPPVTKTPSVDRSTKPPETTPTVTPQPIVPDRSKKPSNEVAKRPVHLLTPAIQIRKKQNLQAVFGTGRHVLTGLRNLGNTCFMNSTLQCLASTTPVIKHFLTGKYQTDINYYNPLSSQGIIAVEFAWLMKAMWSGGYKSVSPRDFKDMIGRFVPQMKGCDQQDSQEFLAFLLDGLHEDLNKVKKKVYIEENESYRDDRQGADLAWRNHLKRNDSIIVSYFQGMFRSSIKCNGCGKSSVTFEPFMYLSLPIPPGQGVWTLEDCVKLFIKAETVEWSCSNCNDPKGKATKKLDIWRVPPVLLIHLKRFTYQGMWREKRQNTINYPTGTNSLNVSQFVAGQQGNPNYTLYAVSNHFGTLTGGHYTACCRNPYNGVFYNFDDHDVKEALPRQVKSSAAYILYYTAVDLSPGRFEFEKH